MIARSSSFEQLERRLEYIAARRGSTCIGQWYIIECMTMHTINEAKFDLDVLIERALAGENIVITRAGEPLIELKPFEGTAGQQPVGGIGPDSIAWLRRIRIKGEPPDEDAGALVSRMRDEDWS